MEHIQRTATLPSIAPADLALGGGLEIEAFGTLSPALVEAAAALQPTVYSFLQGK